MEALWKRMWVRPELGAKTPSRPAVHRRVRGTEEGLLRTRVYQFALAAVQGTADWAVSTAQIYVLTVQRLDVQD